MMHLRNCLLERVRVPSLVLQGDIIDLRVFNEVQAQKQVDAFIEIMDHYEEVRKQEGLGW